jgi:hypothetical protein
MKFSTAPLFSAALLISSGIMAAPFTESASMNNTLAEASIAVINSTVTASATPTTTQPAAITVADAMSGTTATASISIIGQNVTAQSSGSERTDFVGATAIALPIAVISALCLM